MKYQHAFLARIRKYAVVLVFLFAIIYRLPHITHFVNDDDSLWKYRGYVFSTAISHLDFGATAVTYHPGVPLLWSQMFAIKTYGVLDDVLFHHTLVGRREFFTNHLIQNTYLIVFTSLLITGIFVLVRRLYGLRYATGFIGLTLLEPFFISLGRSIHNDMLVSLTCYLAFLSAYIVFDRITKSSSYRHILFSKMSVVAGCVSALGLLTKSASLFLLPLYITLLAFFVFLRRKFAKRYLFAFFSVILLSCVFFILIWPAMWVHPLNTLWLYGYKGIFDTAITDGHLHYWFGKETMDPGYLFYPIVLVGRYTPFLVLGFLVGCAFLIRRLVVSPRKRSDIEALRLELLHIIFFLGYFVMISITSKKLDRYTLPLLFPMVALTIYGIRNIAHKIHPQRKYVYGVVGAFVLFRGILLAYIHPNYLVYYSPLIGGMSHGKDIIEPKWIIGFDQVAEYLNVENAKSRERIVVVTPDAHLLSYFADFKTVYPENTESRKGEYFVVPMYKPRSVRPMMDKFKLLDSMKVKDIRIAGVLYWSIYKK